MTAQIISFGKLAARRETRAASERHFAKFSSLLAFDLPDPTWVSPDLSECTFAPADAAKVREFFLWFGVEVDTTRAPQSLADGMLYLFTEVYSPAAWKVKHPDTFDGMYDELIDVQVEYFDAVIAGDWDAAARLVRRTPNWVVLQEKMHTLEASRSS